MNAPECFDVLDRAEEGDHMQDNDLHYHRERATRELDMGLIASSAKAARAHLKLASMHMDCVRKLATSSVDARPPLTM